MKVIILSGAPGSGKSTWAANLPNNIEVVRVSADDYFVNRQGVYLFNPAKLGEAHGECLYNFMQEFRFTGRLDLLVVDNTNTALMEMAPYVRIAQAYGREVEFRHFLREGENSHGVPPDKVDAMRRKVRGMLLDDFGYEVGGPQRLESRTFRGVWTEVIL